MTQQIRATLRDGREVLVDLFESGTVEVSERAEAGELWRPVGDVKVEQSA